MAVDNAFRHRIQTLVPLAIAARPDHTAAVALEEIDAAIPPRGFAGLSHVLRGAETGPGWKSITYTDVHPELPQAALRFLTCHRDGRVREAAVRSLDQSPASIRWLLLRVNDCYHPLAMLAVWKVAARIVPDGARHWLSYLNLVAGFSRASVQVIQTAIDDCAAAHPQVFESFLADPLATPANRRQAWETLWRHHPDRARAAAASSPDVTLRSRSLRSSWQPEHFRSFLSDPVPALRREALQRLWESGPLPQDVLEQALLDRAASVRETAKYCARKSGQEQTLTVVYRQAPICAGKLEGMVGVLPTEEAQALLEQQVNHPGAMIARAALSALDRLLPDPEPRWWSMLQHEADARKRCWAGRLLKARRSFYLSGEIIWNAYDKAEPPIRDELLALAERSPCPHTRLRALYQRVHDRPESLSPEDFHNRRETIARALPPYAYPRDKAAVLQEIASGWREDWRAVDTISR